MKKGNLLPARVAFFVLSCTQSHYKYYTNILAYIRSKAIPGNNDHTRTRQAFKAGLYSETKYKKRTSKENKHFNQNG